MLPWCCQLFSDQSESIVLCCQSFSADVQLPLLQLPWRKTGHHHHLAIRKVYGSDVNLKRSDPGPAHHPHLAIRKAWGWDVNLKRSDEDKARDGGAAVVSESVFRSVRIETRDKIEIFWYFPSKNNFVDNFVKNCSNWNFAPADKCSRSRQFSDKEVVGKVVHVTSPGLVRDLPMFPPPWPH